MPFKMNIQCNYIFPENKMFAYVYLTIIFRPVTLNTGISYLALIVDGTEVYAGLFVYHLQTLHTGFITAWPTGVIF